MIELLVWLIILCIVGGLLYYLVTLLPLPAPFPMIIRVAVIVICILVLLSFLFGGIDGLPIRNFK